MTATVLILPGLGGSGPEHWQTRWEQANPSFIRVNQRDWDHPVCDEWCAMLEHAVARVGANTVLAAHSLGCLLVAHWAARTQLAIRAALLVAPPDPDGVNWPPEITGFRPLRLAPLAFPSIVVASTNDPYGGLAFARGAASEWGSGFVNIGAAGHINSESGFGEWHAGLALLRELAG